MYSAASQAVEEYVVLADFVTDADGELSVSAGDVVQLVSRETTGNQSVSHELSKTSCYGTQVIESNFYYRIIFERVVAG